MLILLSRCDLCPVVSVSRKLLSGSHTHSLFCGQWSTKRLWMELLCLIVDVCCSKNRAWRHQPSGGKEPHWLFLTVCKPLNVYDDSFYGRLFTHLSLMITWFWLVNHNRVLVSDTWLQLIHEGERVKQLFPEVCQVPVERSRLLLESRMITDLTSSSLQSFLTLCALNQIMMNDFDQTHVNQTITHTHTLML